MIIEKVAEVIVSYMKRNNKVPKKLIISRKDLLKLKKERRDVTDRCYGLEIDIAFEGIPLYVTGD